MFTWFLWFHSELSPRILKAKVSLYPAMEKHEEEGTMSHESVCEQQHELLLLLLLNIHG